MIVRGNVFIWECCLDCSNALMRLIHLAIWYVTEMRWGLFVVVRIICKRYTRETSIFAICTPRMK